MTLEQIYRQHFRFVWRALARLGVPERDLPDAVQDVFVVVHEKLAAFEGRSRIETWLYGICLRTASDRRRSAASRLEVYGDERERVSPALAPSEAAELSERVALLERVLSTLPIEQRAVFVLFEIDAVPCERIAELLEIPLGTVFSRLRLARASFKKKLSQLEARERFQFSGALES